MKAENWWNDADSRKPKYSEKTLSQSHIFYHKFQCRGVRTGPPRREAKLTAGVLKDQIPMAQ